MELQIWKGDWGLPSIDLQSLAVIAYCKMCGHDIPLVECKGSWNGKRLPVLTLSETGEYLETPQNIINFLISKEIQMDEHLPPKQLSEITAMTSMITDSLYTSLMLAMWLDEQNYQNVMLPLYKTVYKLPFSYLKAMQMRRYIKCMVLSRFSLDDNVEISSISSKVFEKSKICLQILSTKLGSNQYIFGNVPSQLDAYIFSHLALIRSSPIKSQLKDDLGKLANLSEYTQRIHKKYFPKLFRQFTPDNPEHALLSPQMLNQVASASAVVLLALIFFWYRTDNKLLINDQKMEQHS